MILLFINLPQTRGGGRARNSDDLFVYTKFHARNIPSDSQETSLQIYTHVLVWKLRWWRYIDKFKLEMKMR